jgi:adenylate cyclase
VLLTMTMGMALIYNGEERQRGFDMLRDLRETCVAQRFALNIVSFIDAFLALELMENGQHELALQHWRTLTDEMIDDGNFANVDIPLMLATEALISRGESDEANRLIEKLDVTTMDRGWRSREVSALRLRTLLAQARGDDAYRDLRDRYRAMSNELGFEGHMKWAAEMR